MNLKKANFLTRDQLKILAAFLMLVDHIGVMLYPDIQLLRIIGRLSFPIFSFLIAEGCVYTKNRRKYFFGIFLLGILCQLVFYVTQQKTDFGILITFSFSILLCSLFTYVKQTLFSYEQGIAIKLFVGIAFVLALCATFLLNRIFYVDYGFFGCVLPLFASIFRSIRVNGKTYLKPMDKNWIHVLCFGIGLYVLSLEYGIIQMYSLWAIPLLLLYSGKRGKYRLKLFFYIFYPAHFVVLWLIQQLFFR